MFGKVIACFTVKVNLILYRGSTTNFKTGIGLPEISLDIM